jgi:hypothetical protein
MAYKGYNFLPTSYGYKSYFGTAQKLAIDALNTRIDYVFIYQNLAYENILIALTESGVWLKEGDSSGPWINTIPYIASEDIKKHYNWSYVIIANTLYAYMQGRNKYIKFDHSSITKITAVEVAPNFLNMSAQVGIFRASGRLAFWDTDDSTSWANLDDFADFSPSLETLAGNSKFADIQGRIVTIREHGSGFIIYSTKSIVYISQSLDSVFQWKPQIILGTAGISYPRQVTVASPDTIHFVYSSEGLKKIEMAREETIVPEVTDFLKDYGQPVYLKILQGRYLFLEILDQNYITGNIQLTEEEVPEVDYTFPGGGNIENIPPIEHENDLCPIIGGIGDGGLAGSQPPTAPLDKKSGTSVKPIWTCWISRAGAVNADNITWTSEPCHVSWPDGSTFDMAPAVAGLDKLGQTSTNKTPVTGVEAYVDGIWTIERFIQTQSAIWEQEQRVLNDVITKISNRSKSVSISGEATSCVESPANHDECKIGRFAAKYSAPKFGMSKCSFWLTRYAIAAVDLIRVKSEQLACGPLVPKYGQWHTNLPGSLYPADSPSASLAAYNGANNSNVQLLGCGLPQQPDTPIYDPDGGCACYLTTGSGFGIMREWTMVYKTSTTVSAYNKVVDVDVINPTPDTGYCEITGWSYTKQDGTIGTIPKSDGCSEPTIFPKNSAGQIMSGGIKPPISTANGSLCGTPYIPPIIEGTPVIWPPQTITLPPSSFLLQLGSPAPLYPTFVGALVYDLQLKKWGKMNLRYKELLDYSPINSTKNGVVPSNVFGIDAGMVDSQGRISLFDRYPSDSYISYGKVGYDRLGSTSPEEVTVHFKSLSTGLLKIETSLGGKNLSAGLVITEDFKDASKATIYGGYPGRWCNIEISGIYDINYLEFRGFTQGRR